MPSLDRRQFIRGAGAVVAVTAWTGRVQGAYDKLRIGAPDWNLQLEAKPGSVELAKSIGFPKVVEAIAGIGFSGWARLETASPSGDVPKDMKANLGFIRALFRQH